MTAVVTWTPGMRTLGPAVVTIGVFDGVHMGHQSLLADTVADAAARGVAAVAITFDRDPDQVVSPHTAAPQLLTLADKLEFIGLTGVDVVLVVPFTRELCEISPEGFLDSVVLRALRPLGVHVGRDFRFGTHASGDVAELQRLGLSRDFEVAGHDLVASGGSAVTSTRIRRLIAVGDMTSATELLTRAPRVTGVVRRGRGEGAKLGFPTANVAPVPFAALPADGVYAGRSILASGEVWASAISVGTPPSFPEARDYLEAHLIDFEADIYDQPITVEFFDRLRDQRRFDSLEELASAIGADVDAALEIAGFGVESSAATPHGADVAEAESWNPNPLAAFVRALSPGVDDEASEDGAIADGSSIVDDPEALEAAERAVQNTDSSDTFESVEGDWSAVVGPIAVSELSCPGGWNGLRITMPLEAAGIPYAWQPYDPAQMPSFRPAYGLFDRTFTLYVPALSLALAREALSDAGVEVSGQSDSDDSVRGTAPSD